MTPLRIVFLGSKPIGYTCFQYLLENRDKLNAEVIGVRTRSRKEFGEGNDLTELAAKHFVPVLGSLDEIPECDIIYSVQHHELLRCDHIKKAAQIAVNLHMAPLPEYRGCNQYSFAIIDGRKEFGTSIHKIDERIDHGDLLFEERFPIPDNCWVNELYELTFKASVRLFQKTLSDIIYGRILPMPQKNLEAKHGSALHYRNEMQTLKEIDLSWDKEKIERHIRATSMPGFEPPFTMIGDRKIYFKGEE